MNEVSHCQKEFYIASPELQFYLWTIQQNWQAQWENNVWSLAKAWQIIYVM